MSYMSDQRDPRPGNKAPDNGPRQKPGAGRNRQSAGNGKAGGAGVFPLGPSDQAAYGSQKNNLFANYAQQVKNLKYEKKTARLLFRQQRGDIRQQMETDLQLGAGVANERGIIGSTQHLYEDEGVKGAAQGELAAAQVTKSGTIQQALLAQQQALIDRNLGLGDLMLQKRAAQREMALSAFASAGMNPWGYTTNTSG